MGDHGHAVTPANTCCTPRAGREPQLCFQMPASELRQPQVGWGVGGPVLSSLGSSLPTQPPGPSSGVRLCPPDGRCLVLSVRPPETEGSRQPSLRLTLHVEGYRRRGVGCPPMTGAAGCPPQQPGSSETSSPGVSVRGGALKGPRRQETGLGPPRPAVPCSGGWRGPPCSSRGPSSPDP